MRRVMLSFGVGLILLATSVVAEEPSQNHSMTAGFVRGDCNGDAVITLADVIHLMHYLYGNGPVPFPVHDVGDANCDSHVNIIDVVYIVNHVLRGGPKPKCPN